LHGVVFTIGRHRAIRPTEGASNKIIARKLVITESTVKVHMKAILRKLRLQNRTQAAIWARTNLGTLLENVRIAMASRVTMTVRVKESSTPRAFNPTKMM
jgi:Bacterial regulatory proteins, luxR family